MRSTLFSPVVRASYLGEASVAQCCVQKSRTVRDSNPWYWSHEFTMLAIGQGNRDQTWQRTALEPSILWKCWRLSHTHNTRARCAQVRTQCVEKWREYSQINCLNWPINVRFAVREPITFKDAFCSVVPWRKWNSRHLRKKFEEIFSVLHEVWKLSVFCSLFPCFAKGSYRNSLKN